jgi:hypothetical protein
MASLDIGNQPEPRALISKRPGEGRENPHLTAYAPTATPEPDAQRALQMLIEQRLKEDSADKTRTATALTPGLLDELPELEPVTYEVASDRIRTASIGAGATPDALGNLIESTWTSITRAGVPKETATLDLALINVSARPTVLIAPDLDHVTEIFADPQPMHSNRYAVIFEPDEADFNPATELGPYGRRVGFSLSSDTQLSANGFARRAPLLSAAR